MTTGVDRLMNLGLAAALALDLAGAADSLTATASGTQTTSAIVPAAFNRYSTVATAGDGAGLPFAQPGATVTITNGAAIRPMTIFAQGSDTVNGGAGSTGFQLPPGKTAIFSCSVAGRWNVNLSA